MRFRAPRSISPSPVRQKPRQSSTFGLQSDTEESGSDGSSDSGSSADSSESESGYSSSSSDSLFYAPVSKASKTSLRLVRPAQSLAESRNAEETVAAIRLRTRHHDPYEEWERQTRLDAFRSARKDLNAAQIQLHHNRDNSRTQEMDKRTALHAQQMKEIEARLEGLRMKQKTDEDKLKAGVKERQRRIWEGIEGVIKIEEDKVKAKLEEERKQKEEQERKRLEEEARRKALEEKRLEEQRKKEEEEKREKEEMAQKEKEAEEAQRRQEALAELETNEKSARGELGMTKPEQDWTTANLRLQELKTQVMRPVKANPSAKTEWSKWRRQMTPKIGQITDDAQEINRISLQLYRILHPTQQPPHQPIIYKALLSSLSKAILLQAETEVTAEKKSAGPLARVAFNLLETLDGFPEVFFAKIIERAGGWPLPYLVPSEDIGSGPWKSGEERSKAAEKAYKKAMRYRKSSSSDDLESHMEYTSRVSGMMRVYFHLLQLPPQQKPLHAMFQLPRYWIWFSRLLTNKKLLEAPIAPQLIYTALDVMGSHARKLWGRQWNKMLGLIFEGVTSGYDQGKLIGGTSAEGVAARGRVVMEIERILLDEG